jgi:hypothetical protein
MELATRAAENTSRANVRSPTHSPSQRSIEPSPSGGRGNNISSQKNEIPKVSSTKNFFVVFAVYVARQGGFHMRVVLQEERWAIQ